MSLISYIRYFDDVALIGVEFKLTVHIGNGSVGSAFNFYVYTNQWLTLSVGNGTVYMDCRFLLRCLFFGSRQDDLLIDNFISYISTTKHFVEYLADIARLTVYRYNATSVNRLVVIKKHII